MRVLVTGSNGFIGHHVCSWFRDQGIEVVGLGRSAQPVCEVDGYIQCDLASDEVAHIPSKAGSLDGVIHLAADMRHEPYAVSVVETNCGGTQRLLEMCEATEVPVFLQLSSLPVIGRPRELPITEEHSLRPPTVYHVTKHTQEMLAEYATYTFGLRTASFRICSPVGEGVNPKTIFPTFVRRALAGDDLVLLGEGGRQQTYIHVDDISQALYLALTKPEGQGVYNLASHNKVSNADLAARCIELLGSESRIVFQGEDACEHDDWDISLEKIKTDLGFQPQRGLDHLILDLADAFRKGEWRGW